MHIKKGSQVTYRYQILGKISHSDDFFLVPYNLNFRKNNSQVDCDLF